jgi:hypothetical protein
MRWITWCGERRLSCENEGEQPEVVAHEIWPLDFKPIDLGAMSASEREAESDRHSAEPYWSLSWVCLSCVSTAAPWLEANSALGIPTRIFRILEDGRHFDSVSWLHWQVERQICANFVHIDDHDLVITKQSDFSSVGERRKSSSGVDRTQNRQIWSKRDTLRRLNFSTDIYEPRLRPHRDRHSGICIDVLRFVHILDGGLSCSRSEPRDFYAADMRKVDAPFVIDGVYSAKGRDLRQRYTAQLHLNLIARTQGGIRHRDIGCKSEIQQADDSQDPNLGSHRNGLRPCSERQPKDGR